MIELSEQQREAVEHMGTPALVVAGAGAGKTRTLTAKIAFLISRGFAPERILAVTFTNRAADEMKSRLVNLTSLDPRAFPWVRTVHSACYIILTQYCHMLGYEKPLQVLGRYHQEKIIKEILAKFNCDKKYSSQILGTVSRAKNSLNPMKDLEYANKRFPVPVSEVYDLYEKALKEQNAVDYDNILLKTRDILKEFQDVREKYRRLFQFILVDEYQDSNDIQEELTGLFLGNENLFCVGDDWQAVYGFRGSNINHFLKFTGKYKNAKMFKLEQNYRSSSQIVQLANKLINYNENRIEKECFSDKTGGVVREKEFFDAAEEAEWVAKAIAALHAKKKIPYREMAVMYRTRFLSLDFEKTLRRRDIPYKIVGARGFFNLKEILDLLSYLAAAVFPRDDVSFVRIMNTPRRGIGPGALREIEGERREGMSLQETVRACLDQKLLKPKLARELTGLMSLLDSIAGMSPEKAVRETMEAVGYEEHLKQYLKSGNMDFTARMENIDQLIWFAAEKENIADFLEEAALISDDRTDEDADAAGRVSLLTIHAAKGLEFLTVFVAGCEEDVLPHWKCKYSEKELAEERRLMYVAITRARRNLYLTRAMFRRGRDCARSRFLYEINDETF